VRGYASSITILPGCRGKIHVTDLKPLGLYRVKFVESLTDTEAIASVHITDCGKAADQKKPKARPGFFVEYYARAVTAPES